MVLMDAATSLVLVEERPNEKDHKDVSPFIDLESGLARFWRIREENKSTDEAFDGKDLVAMRRVLEPFIKNYTDRSPIVPWIKERLNSDKHDKPPCHRHDLEHIKGRHNWRDEGADVAAIPYAPPLVFLLHPPEKLYDPDKDSRGLQHRNDLDLEALIYESIYERGTDHLWSISAIDEEYRKALYRLNESPVGDMDHYRARLMVTWAIDSAIPAVDVQRVAKHAGSIEAICGDSPNLLEIPGIATLSQYAREAQEQLNQIYEGLGEMADNANSYPFANYEESSVKLYMKTRSIVDTCRWYLENDNNLTAPEREILNKTLVESYTTYHAVVQTCGSTVLDDIRAQAHRDVSTLLAGGKVDIGVGGEDLACIDLSGEEDYLGAFMAVSTYDSVSQEFVQKMLNGFTIRLDWHGGARSYFGTFESNPEATMRQQLTLMCVLFFRMPKWQQEAYSDLLFMEFSKKQSRAMEISSIKNEHTLLYIPTQDLPVDVGSRYSAAFDWMSESEIQTAQRMMPLLDLIANNRSILEDDSPRIQIKPGDRHIAGVDGSVNEKGIFVPSAQSEILEENTPPIFIDLLKELDQLSSTDFGTVEWGSEEYVKITSQKLRLIEKFARSRTFETSKVLMPFLEPRLNSMPLDISPCLVKELPPTYTRNNWEYRADHALIPHLPPIEFLRNPPPNLWNFNTALDKGMEAPIGPYGERIIRQELMRAYGDVPELEPVFNDHDRLMQLYYTWAEDTRVDGIEAYYAETHQRDLQNIFSEGTTSGVGWLNSKRNKGELSLILPRDLLLEVGKCEAELFGILDKAKEWLQASNVNKFEPDQLQISQLSKNIQNIILAARWHIDHRTELDPSVMSTELSTLTNTLETAYLCKNILIQELCMAGTSHDTSANFHDLSALIAGYKIDTIDTATHGDRIMPSYQNDYFSAFMTVATAREVAVKHQEIFGEIEEPINSSRQKGARAILGTFEVQAHSKQQQLALLTTLYFRMPRWQRKAYKVIIDSHFDAIQNEIAYGEMNIIDDEPLLFIPSASIGKERFDVNQIYEFGKPVTFLGYEQEFSKSEITKWRARVVRARYLDPLEKCTSLIASPSIKKNTHGVEVFHSGSFVEGYGSNKYWIDHLGFLHPGYESKVNIETQVLNSEVAMIVEKTGKKIEDNWLNNLVELPPITVESRLGSQMAEKIESLLDQDIKNGSIENLSSLSVILELLLGRKLTEGDSKYLEMLKSFGMLNNEVLDIASMSEKDITDMLAYIKTEKPSIENMDESSLILLYLGAAGVAPRQELVEQTIKAHETTSNILALQALVAIESIANKKKFDLLKILKLKPKEELPKTFLARRDDLRSYLAQKKADNDNYDFEGDSTWREMQLDMLKYIVGLVKTAKSYDSSADTTLYSVLAARDKGKLSMRCQTNGEILTILAKLGIAELGVYLTGDYGPEGNLSVPEFLRNLNSAEESGGSSHGYSSANRASVNSLAETEVWMADGDSGEVIVIPAPQVARLDHTEISFGILANHDYKNAYVNRTRVFQSCVNGGSTTTASIALAMRQIDLSAMADPDDKSLNMLIINAQADGNHIFPLERRANALRKMMAIHPYYLAMSAKNDYSRAVSFEQLHSVIELGNEVGNWGAAFFAANIMKNAKFFGEKANKTGESYLEKLAANVAMLSQGKYEAVLRQHKDFLTPSDLDLISNAHEEYLAALAELNRTSGTSARKNEKQLKRMRRERARDEFGKIAIETNEIKNTLTIEEKKRSASDIAANGFLEGREDKKKYIKNIEKHVEQIVSETVDPDKSTFDDARFELLNARAQEALLLTAISDSNNRMLEGRELEVRLLAMQEMFVKYAHDHTRLRGGKMGSGLMLAGGRNNILVDGFENMAMRLNGRLEAAIERKGLKVELPKFEPRKIAERMGRAGTQKLLGRNKTPQLDGAVQ